MKSYKSTNSIFTSGSAVDDSLVFAGLKINESTRGRLACGESFEDCIFDVVGTIIGESIEATGILDSGTKH